MNCEHVNCNAPGLISAHGGRWCKCHINDIKRIRRDIDAVKPVRKSMLEFVNGKLVLVKSEDRQVVGDFLSDYEKNKNDEDTRRKARAVLGRLSEQLRVEESLRKKESVMRKRRCAGHDKFRRECVVMIEKAEIDLSKIELVEDVENVISRDVDSTTKSEMIDFYNKKHKERIASIKFDVGRM